MNTPRIPQAAKSPAELLDDLQHIIEANETTRIVVREACASLIAAVETHLAEIDAHVRRLTADMKRR
ncbi:MAG: hypothetical protein ABUL73_00825 [Alphaproteobacteria bacterium]